MNDTLHIWQPRPKNEVVAIMSAATVATSLFLPVREMWNNSANKFFDALAASTPNCRSTMAAGKKIFCSKKGVGIRIPYNDVVKAAADLATFVHDPARLAKARRAAHDLAYGAVSPR